MSIDNGKELLSFPNYVPKCPSLNPAHTGVFELLANHLAANRVSPVHTAQLSVQMVTGPGSQALTTYTALSSAHWLLCLEPPPIHTPSVLG